LVDPRTTDLITTQEQAQQLQVVFAAFALADPPFCQPDLPKEIAESPSEQL
jgi:hypothetical protein